MSQTRRVFFADSVSSTEVQLRRAPAASGGDPNPSADAGLDLHQVNIVTGNASAANANTAFWVANCTRYEVTIRRLT